MLSSLLYLFIYTEKQKCPSSFLSFSLITTAQHKLQVYFQLHNSTPPLNKVTLHPRRGQKLPFIREGKDFGSLGGIDFVQNQVLPQTTFGGLGGIDFVQNQVLPQTTCARNI